MQISFAEFYLLICFISSFKQGNCLLARLSKYKLNNQKHFSSSSSSSSDDLNKKQNSIISRKWISLSVKYEMPSIFDVVIDNSIQIVNDLKRAIKKEAMLSVPVDEIKLEYPSGTPLDKKTPISEIAGGNTDEDPILGSLVKSKLISDVLVQKHYLIHVIFLMCSFSSVAIFTSSIFEG
jgi:hypothetical protein